MRRHDYAPPAHLKWLLDSDPAIRWQVMRDLTVEAPNAIAAERSRVATEGWGAYIWSIWSFGIRAYVGRRESRNPRCAFPTSRMRRLPLSSK